MPHDAEEAAGSLCSTAATQSIDAQMVCLCWQLPGTEVMEDKHRTAVPDVTCNRQIVLL